MLKMKTKGPLLSRISPFSQLVALFSLVIPVFLSFDPYTPTAFLLLALFQILALGRVSIKRLWQLRLPILALPLGLLVLNVFFTQTAGQEAIARFLFITITGESFRRGTILFLRSLTLIVISIGYLLVTEPLKLTNALMQQAGLSPRIGFSIYVAWHTLPLLKEDLRRIKYTHRIRLRGDKRKTRRLIPTAVTLLTGAIRHAERASISMAARGLEKEVKRSFFKASPWRNADSVYLLSVLLLIGLIMAILIRQRLFVFGLS